MFKLNKLIEQKDTSSIHNTQRRSIMFKTQNNFDDFDLEEEDPIGKDNTSRYRAPALEKGLDIIELLAEHAEGLAQGEVARAFGRSQSEIYRMLATLVRRGYIIRSHIDGKYSLALKMFALSQKHPPTSRLIQFAVPMMREASQKMHQSCLLGIENNGNIVVVASVAATGSWGLTIRTGAVVGLNNTGIGRVIAAFSSPEDCKRILKIHVPVPGEPPTNKKEFINHLKTVKERGYEKMPSETLKGVINLAFPIFDPHGKVRLALSCPYIQRIDGMKAPSVDEAEAILLELSRELSRGFSNTL